MKVVKINKGKTIAFHIRFAGIIVAIAICMKLLTIQPMNLAILLTIPFTMLVPAIWFASNIITIDMDKMEIHDGVWVLGRKFGKPEKFNSIDKFFMNKVKTRQTMYSLSNNQNISTNSEFKVFVKLNNGDKYFLFSHPLEERVEEKLNEVKLKLGLKS
ncbi:MAG: hypothetical protein AB8B73_01125 [Ekhidna sp.]